MIKNKKFIFRRPMFVCAVVLTIFFYLYTNYCDIRSQSDYLSKGVVRNISEKIFYEKIETDKHLLYIKKHSQQINIGDIIVYRGKSMDFDKYKDDDFDFNRYVKSKGLKGAVRVEKVKIVGKDYFFTFVGLVKTYIRDTNRFLYKKESDFLNSIIIGDRDGLDRQTINRFTRAGTSHILAISGLHIDIIFTFIIFLSGSLRNRKKLSLVLILLFIYWFISGFSFSALRAILMLAIGSFASIEKRRNDLLSSLATAYIIIITANPWAIYNLGLQLSILACLSACIYNNLIKKYVKISIISISIACNVLTIPLIIESFSAFSFSFIIGNMLTIPMIASIMIFDFISLFLYKINISLSIIVSVINRNLVKLTLWLNTLAGDFSFSYMKISSQDLKFLLIYYIMVFALSIYVYRKRLRESFNGTQRFFK